MVVSLTDLKRSFWNKEFVLVSFFFVLMWVIYLLGDFLIGGVLWLHMIPEIFGLYVLGYWMCNEKFSRGTTLLAYILATVFVPVIVGSNPYWAGVFVCGVLGGGVLLGYYNATRRSS